jgi:hypothetical protein
MKIDPETGGKIIGMLMAYFVSFLGLLLAYYNYKKRGPGAKNKQKDINQGENK